MSGAYIYPEVSGPRMAFRFNISGKLKLLSTFFVVARHIGVWATSEWRNGRRGRNRQLRAINAPLKRRASAGLCACGAFSKGREYA